MRHALITIRLLDQARDGAIAQAETEPGRVVSLARRVRALVARTSFRPLSQG